LKIPSPLAAARGKPTVRPAGECQLARPMSTLLKPRWGPEARLHEHACARRVVELPLTASRSHRGSRKLFVPTRSARARSLPGSLPRRPARARGARNFEDEAFAEQLRHALCCAAGPFAPIAARQKKAARVEHCPPEPPYGPQS